MPKEWGLPPIGFRNMFSPKAWKRLFHKSKDFVSDETQPFLSVKNLVKTYNTHRIVKAVNGVDFDIQKGEIILLIGPNGSGKSTLLQSLTGALTTDSGSVSIFGNEASFLDLQKCTGYCYQNNVFFDNLTVRKHLEFFARLRSVKKEQMKD
ncbi:hypothetical protein TVAG_254070 [Trichomonas vaginalis G3]|uniref:ABC transporter domain-containing protein n=1 Tax=Trichomonas vaginalis (strain ATCC PRA-98 / G3) TaxID=412133 RepID=A2DMS4_TRIV3|nr:ATPase activity, coupled to transmembrane movement of substances [Trichomonas vaginalis G3]EAY18295.1 hypothetical protein TVAG_254070 [Trichomonas vaginalis G3]KAI5541882.1 ATPase activity, coupled to transmembrane movement of substances [Trichomonas vaginalis G3]|eukprot:XP_001579281.1 hypothetical protein [Trichomonas vaginalis G3]